MSEEQTKYESQQLTDIEIKAIKYMLFEIYVRVIGNLPSAPKTKNELKSYVCNNMLMILKYIYKYDIPTDIINEWPEEQKIIVEFINEILEKFKNESLKI